MPFFDTIVYPERKGHRFLEKKNHEKEIQMSCGHLETVDLSGDYEAAEKKNQISAGRRTSLRTLDTSEANLTGRSAFFASPT